MAAREAIRFKGTRQGVHLVIDPGADLSTAMVELDQRLRGTDQFFRSSAVMLNLGDRPMEDAEVTTLQEVLARYGLTIVSVEASHTDTRSIFRGQGLSVEMPGSQTESGAPENGRGGAGGRSREQPEGVVFQRTLRSGQSLQQPGDICLIGDVNPGAEIIAGGNVIVWGSLRGVAQAGLGGDESAVVCALELAPTQLRIGSLVTRQPEAQDPQVPAPEMARIAEGHIVVDQWIPRARRARGRSG